jgi:hypothetical protein
MPNIENSNICLYFHINSVKNEVFYVGIGNEKRPYVKHKRSKLWNNVVKKYNYVVDIIEEGLSWKEACEKERFYIAKIGRKDKGLGPLVNHTDGGEGAKGIIHSLESRLKNSNSHKGLPSNSKGIKWNHTQETKNEMSKIHLGKGTKQKGKSWSEKRRQAQINRKNKNNTLCPQSK